MDLDKGNNSEISYTISSNKQFIMSSNGTLMLTGKLDHEQDAQHVLSVIAKDSKWKYLYKPVGYQTLKESFYSKTNWVHVSFMGLL